MGGSVVQPRADAGTVWRVRVGIAVIFALFLVWIYSIFFRKDPPRVWREIGESAGPELSGLDGVMKQFMVERGISAGTLAITYQGRLMLAKGYSWAPKDEEPVGPHSLFRIASVSKPITAVAIFHLVDAGKLKLEEKVVDVLGLSSAEGKVMDGRLRKVTILHLLQHLGGWDRGKSYDPMFLDRRIASELGIPLPIGTADIVRFMNGEPLQFEPGATNAYSNYGYCLLGRVVEKRTGMAYEEYVRKEILAPLSIEDMSIGKSRKQERAKAEVVYDDAAAYGTFRQENLDAHGGWIASAVDLVRFASALDDTNRCPVLSAGSIERMFAVPENMTETAYKLGDSYYACGWSVRDYGNGKRDTWHTGGLPGTYAFLVRWRGGIDLAVLFNRSGYRYDRICPAIGKAVHQIKQWPPGDLFNKTVLVRKRLRRTARSRCTPPQSRICLSWAA